MRDDFRKDVKDILAARVGHLCSNPTCRAATSGPAEQPNKAVNVGVAAHITAAAEGGPRYDPSLTSEKRSSPENGIWLCQTDAKLVDNDAQRYPVEVLQQWKLEAERRRRVVLSSRSGPPEVGLDLVIPRLDSPESVLSFANSGVPYIDRGEELDSLKAFLDAEMPFSWWLLAGPGGIGKSRVAVELCKWASPSWHAGFLREAHQSRLGDLQTVLPTLVVIDYASQRSGWLAEALAQLSQRTLSSKVRVLILEREAAGPWWERVQVHDRMEESILVAANMYALPGTVTGFNRDGARELVKSTAGQLGCTALTTTQIEDIVDAADTISPEGRPLFIQIATMDWLDSRGKIGGRDDAIRRLIGRSTQQTARRVGDAAMTRLAINTQIFATALGGLGVDEYAALAENTDLPAGLLPREFEVLGSLTLDDLIDGVRPDMVGELFVLDQLGSSGTNRRASMALLKQACLWNPDAYRGFAERAAADHTDHPNLTDLLQAIISDESPLLHLDIGVALIPALQRSDHEVIGWIFERLLSEDKDSGTTSTARLLAVARFHVGNLLIREDKNQEAYDLYTIALANCNPIMEQYGSILNSRGVALTHLGQLEAAIADFAAVFDAPSASDEARACALNNRADLLSKKGDLDGAISDRSAVLQLADTTYNRRYIALIRRAIALRRKGDEVGAFEDIGTILETDDIAEEQKMAARLQRAEWLIEADELIQARLDLDAIVVSRRNFDDVREKALELRNR